MHVYTIETDTQLAECLAAGVARVGFCLRRTGVRPEQNSRVVVVATHCCSGNTGDHDAVLNAWLQVLPEQEAVAHALKHDVTTQANYSY